MTDSSQTVSDVNGCARDGKSKAESDERASRLCSGIGGVGAYLFYQLELEDLVHRDR